MTPDLPTHSAPPDGLDEHTGNLASEADLETVPEVFRNEVRNIFIDTLTGTLERLMAPVAQLEVIRRKIYLSEEDVSVFFSIATATLKTNRCRGAGPRYVKDGRKILYLMDDLVDYYKRRLIRTRG